MGGTFPSDFITWLEILLGGEADMLMCNAASGYNYGQYMTLAMQSAGFSAEDISKVKIWNSGYPKVGFARSLSHFHTMLTQILVVHRSPTPIVVQFPKPVPRSKTTMRTSKILDPVVVIWVTLVVSL